MITHKERKVIERPLNIISKILKSGYLQLEKNIFMKKTKTGYVVIALTKKYLIISCRKKSI